MRLDCTAPFFSVLLVCLTPQRVCHALRPARSLLRGAAVQASGAAEGNSMLTGLCGSYNHLFEADPAFPQVLDVCQSLPTANLMDLDVGLYEESLNFSRCSMPQLPIPDEGNSKWHAWEAANSAAGISVQEINTNVGELVKNKPSQSFIDLCEACSVAYTGSLCFNGGLKPSDATCEAKTNGCFCAWTSGISISEDGHVLDGHHRWAAAKILLQAGVLESDTPARMEHYSIEAGIADVLLINETAARNPDLVTYTDCSLDNQYMAF